MVKRNKTALELFILHEQLTELIEPAMTSASATVISHGGFLRL
jgi:hypothetical protein